MHDKDNPQPPSAAEWDAFIAKVKAFEKNTGELLRNIDVNP